MKMASYELCREHLIGKNACPRCYEEQLAEKDKQLKYANDSRETIRLKMILALAEKDKHIKELEADINAFRSGVDFYAREQAALSERDVAWKRIKELETVAMTEIASLKAKIAKADSDLELVDVWDMSKTPRELIALARKALRGD